MKVLIQGRSDILTKPGGDYLSIQDKINYLEDKGVYLEFNSDSTISLEKYDLVQIHQSILNTHSVKLLMDNAIKWNKPVVIKPFYNPIRDTDHYLKNGQTVIVKFFYKFIDDFYFYLKLRNLFYSIFNFRINSFFRQLLIDIKKQQIKIINNAFIIPDSQLELDYMEKELNIRIKNYKIVHASLNINDELKNVPSGLFFDKYGLEKIVLCVGRIEPLKNQINFLKALQGLDAQVVIVGNMQTYQKTYNVEFKKLINKNSNFHWIENMNRKMLFSAYKNAHVVAIPSWTETAGMTGLEGGYFDCNIVATKRGACKEYFQKSAWYLDPGDLNSIRQAVLEAFNSSKGCKSFKERISSDYSLEKTSQELFDAYCDAIKRNNE